MQRIFVIILALWMLFQLLCHAPRRGEAADNCDSCMAERRTQEFAARSKVAAMDRILHALVEDCAPSGTMADMVSSTQIERGAVRALVGLDTPPEIMARAKKDHEDFWRSVQRYASGTWGACMRWADENKIQQMISLPGWRNRQTPGT